MTAKLNICLFAVVVLSCLVLAKGQFRPVKCPSDQVYNQCGSACAPTCRDPSPKFCTLQCVSGCFCKAPLVRNNAGKCVRKNNWQIGPVKCPSDQVYRQCGSVCLPTCRDLNPKGCTSKCVSGCFCKAPLVRNNAGKCVPKNNC